MTRIRARRAKVHPRQQNRKELSTIRVRRLKIERGQNRTKSDSLVNADLARLLAITQ